jgi:hypothetical protein
MLLGLHEMEYMGYNVSAEKNPVSTWQVETVADWASTRTQKKIRSLVHFCNYYAKFIHHFSDLTAPLTDLLLKS